MDENRNRKPYRLPKPLLCDPEELEGSGITLDLVKDYIQLHEQRLRRYQYLENLYEGFHDILYLPEKERWKPDWRLAVNFPRYLVTTFAGYGYGKGIKISHPNEVVNEQLQTWQADQEMDAHNSRMVKYCSIYGHAFSYFYQDENAKTCISAEKPDGLFVVYDDTKKRRALFAVRYGRHSTGQRKGKLYGEILTREEIIPFENDRLQEAYLNPYGYIPVVEWMLNDERMGLFEGITTLTESYNSALSNSSNDISYFADQILLALGAELDKDTMDHMRDKRILNLYSDDPEAAKSLVVQYLQKASDNGTSRELLDRLERLIYQISMVANISDDTFSNTSGVALSYKLWSTSNVSADFNTLIKKSIQKEIKIWSSLGTNTGNELAYQDIDIVFNQNVPRNVLEETQTAAQASGIVSHETQLKLLSYVDDAQKEMERIAQEETDEMGRNIDRSLFFQNETPDGQDGADE